MPVAAARREEPAEAKAAASEYEGGHVIADLEQAEEFERPQSDSDEGEEQAGGIIVPYDCPARIFVPAAAAQDSAQAFEASRGTERVDSLPGGVSRSSKRSQAVGATCASAA